MVAEVLRKLSSKEGLSEEEAYEFMGQLMEGQVSYSQMGAFLMAMRLKGETVDELVGFARAMRERMVMVNPRKRPLIDMCGTGGDGANTFNISTAAALVVASADIPVAKHGNRGVSSKCGSADVLAALGVELNLDSQQIADCIDAVGIGFMYAPVHHPGVGYAALPRQELGFRTVFNILGPLVNPANAARQLIGVYEPDLTRKVADALSRLGSEGAIVVHGMDADAIGLERERTATQRLDDPTPLPVPMNVPGLDEVSCIGPTRMSILQRGRIMDDTRTPEEFGLIRSRKEDLRGGETPEENAAIIRAVLSGENGSRRDAVSINAAGGMILGGMANNFKDGIALAHRMIDSGRATKVLDKLVTFTGDFSPAPVEA